MTALAFDIVSFGFRLEPRALGRFDSKQLACKSTEGVGQPEPWVPVQIVARVLTHAIPYTLKP